MPQLLEGEVDQAVVGPLGDDALEQGAGDRGNRLLDEPRHEEVLDEGEHWSISGLCGRIWTLQRDYPRLDGPEDFRAWAQPGTVRVLIANWVEPDGDGRYRVEGELTLAGATQPIGFDVHVGDDGRMTASAVVKQTRWGMKPFSALFGTLKVLDDVEVHLEGRL